MPETILRHGDPIQVDYTPSSGDVAAGEVVLIGNAAGWTNGIAPVAIANNAKGALSAGDGVYECTNLNNAATGAAVYWESNTNTVSNSSTNTSFFGYIVANGAGGTNSACLVIHKPYA